MTDFSPPCQPNQVEVRREYDTASAEGPTWTRTINPRPMRSFRIEFENATEAEAAYMRGLFAETVGGVKPVTFGVSYEIQGNFRITSILAQQLGAQSWAVSGTFEEVLD